ncbi:MAG TPA: J domain-containing protein [Candidatus Nitrosotalea sp.]|nr:J domain-containing protein [Candidatus Nitrosotalea sp.]
MNSDQCYNLLGIRKGASIPEIRDAYRKLALECHPDKNMSARDGAKFKLVTEAYHTLRVGNLSTGKNSDTVSQNQSDMYHKVQSWNFYQSIFYDVIDYAQKIKHAKTVYLYLSKSEPILVHCYNLTQKHATMPLYRLIISSYARTNSLVSHMPYQGAVKEIRKYLGLHS